MIDPRKLHLLAELERLGTIAAVADVVHLSPPAVSMQLSSFERELGIDLTERRGRRLELTPAGRALAAHGRDIADRLALVEFEVDGRREGTVGHYRLAAFPSAARTIVADAWAATAAGNDAITIALTTPEPEDALQALIAGGTDLAVVHGYSNVPRQLPAGVDAVSLGSEPVWLAVRADDAPVADRADLADFADRAWVSPVRSLTCFEMVDRACGLAGFHPRVVAETLDYSVQLELVHAGIGVALVPDLAVGTLPTGVVLVRLRQQLERHLFAAARTGQLQDPGIARLIDLLRSAMNARSERPRPVDNDRRSALPEAQRSSRTQES